MCDVRSSCHIAYWKTISELALCKTQAVLVLLIVVSAPWVTDIGPWALGWSPVHPPDICLIAPQLSISANSVAACMNDDFLLVVALPVHCQCDTVPRQVASHFQVATCCCCSVLLVWQCLSGVKTEADHRRGRLLHVYCVWPLLMWQWDYQRPN